MVYMATVFLDIINLLHNQDNYSINQESVFLLGPWLMEEVL